jgi:hypothetical protein
MRFNQLMHRCALAFGLCLVVSSCAKKDPTSEPVAAVEKASPKSTTQQTTLPSSDADFELATQLRDPDLLNQLDAPESTSTETVTTVKKPSGQVVIKPSDVRVEMPKIQGPIPEPPVQKPEIPGASDAIASPLPANGQ